MPFFVIDLKSFYASCECIMRGLDPFQTALIVADPTRGMGTISLAATPYIKSLGVKSRCRRFEIPAEISYICAKPRMKKYMEFSASVYKCFLKFFSEEDIHVYSIDESFINVGPYITMYNKSLTEIALMVLNEIKSTTLLTATCGIGDNMYLAKIALDILAKGSPNGIAYLDSNLYTKKLWFHEPITDFFQVGSGIAKRLLKYDATNMHDVAMLGEKVLKEEFGVNGIDLYNHAFGYDDTTMMDIKSYVPVSKCFSASQVLFSDYTILEAKTILTEMVYNITLQLSQKKLYCKCIAVSILYSKEIGGYSAKRRSLSSYTASFNELKTEFMSLYLMTANQNKIRRIGIAISELSNIKSNQLNLFDNNDDTKSEKLFETLNDIRTKFGSASVLLALSYTKEATAVERSKMIGGHNSE